MASDNIHASGRKVGGSSSEMGPILPDTYISNPGGSNVCPNCNYTWTGSNGVSDLTFGGWNNDLNVHLWNCYNYAANYKTTIVNANDVYANRAQPGVYWSKYINSSYSTDYPNGWYYRYEIGSYYKDINQEHIHDGFMPNTCFGYSNRGFGPYTLVTAFFLGNPNNGWDYHWIRLCDNGIWCSKQGSDIVKKHRLQRNAHYRPKHGCIHQL